jgi:uncharacterized protein YjiS (DUF1127 family)
MRAEFETRPGPEAGFGPVEWKSVDEAIMRARRLRAEALAEHTGHAVRALAGWAARLLGRIRQARRRRAETHALMMLDDRLLADIGLKRSDVTAAVYGDVPLRPAPVRRPSHPISARRPLRDAPEEEFGRAA